jgi:hypothetical protein
VSYLTANDQTHRKEDESRHQQVESTPEAVEEHARGESGYGVSDNEEEKRINGHRRHSTSDSRYNLVLAHSLHGGRLRRRRGRSRGGLSSSRCGVALIQANRAVRRAEGTDRCVDLIVSTNNKGYLDPPTLRLRLPAAATAATQRACPATF